jgi:NitT/TauT family transport system ATP-binding protein
MSFTGDRSTFPPAASAVRVTGLRKVFTLASGESLTALDSVDLHINRGEILCVVGPSGCGKTTLLRIIAGLEEGTTGEVSFPEDRDEPPVLSIMLEGDSLFPWLTIGGNVAYGLADRARRSPQRQPIVGRLLEMVGLAGFESSYPSELSRGMLSRASFARALASDPEILLMDEPFGAVDEQTRLILQHDLIRICEESGKTILIITHSLDEAILLGDRVVVMTARPGRVKSDIAVPFPRPRDVVDLKSTAAYGPLIRELWRLLEPEARPHRPSGSAHHG